MEENLSSIHETIAELPSSILAQAGDQASSFDDFRQEALRQVEAILALIRDAAKSLERPSSCILRNLIAVASPEQLGPLRQLLAFWDQSSDKREELGLQEVLKCIPAERHRDDAGATTLRWILLGGKQPKLEQAARYFESSPTLTVFYQRDVLNPQKKMTVAGTRTLLSTLSKDSGLHMWNEARKVLVSEGFEKGFPPLDAANFRKLPSAVRRWILEERGFSMVALDAALFTAVWADPMIFPDTPEAQAHAYWMSYTLPNALEALRKRQLSSKSLKELLERKDLDVYASKIVEALKHRSSEKTWRSLSDNTLTVPSGAAKRVGKPASLALNFFSHQRHQRLPSLSKLNNTDLADLIGLLPDDDIFPAILSSNSVAPLRRVRSLVWQNKLFRQAAAQHVIGGNRYRMGVKRPFIACFGEDILRISTAEQLEKILQSCPKLFSQCPPDISAEKKFRTFLGKCLRNSKTATAFLSAVSGAFLGELATSSSPILIKFRGELLDRINQWKKDDLTEAAKRISLYRDTVGGVSSGKAVSREVFGSLLKSARKDRASSAGKLLLTLRDESGELWWRQFFTSSKNAKFLSAAVRAFQPEQLNEATKLYAAYLWREPSFQSAFSLYLRGQKSWRSLGVTREVLRELVPLTWEQHQKTPTLASAYTLALTFSPDDIRLLVSLSMGRLKEASPSNRGRLFDNLYKTHKIRKKSGGFRELHVPEPRLKRLQQRLLRYGFDRIAMDSAAHGFVRGRSILTNAVEHIGKPCVVNVDIDSFFNSTTYPHILRACSAIIDRKYCPYGRFILADLCSFAGALPTGAPTSPAIANFALLGADRAISKVSVKSGVAYTRYADDLTFSGDDGAVRIIPFVEKVLGQLGYKLKERKTNVYRKGRRQMVTGLVVNVKPNIPRRIRRRLRAAVHRCSNGHKAVWQDRPMSMDQLNGRLAFLSMVQPDEAAHLKAKLTGKRKGKRSK